MARDYPVPQGFDSFVYVSQLLQARGMRVAFEAHRRAMPRTMGTLYWQLNDTWPVISWSGRDYFGRWKALHYTARNAFAPLLLSAVRERDSLEVWGVSDLTRKVAGTLSLELLRFDGASLWQASMPTELNGNVSRRLWSESVDSLTGGLDTRDLVLLGELVEEGGGDAFASTLFYFHPPKDLTLQAPAIRLELERSPEGALLTLQSEVLAKDVYLRLAGAGFSENFFDLLPGRPRTVVVRTGLDLPEVERGLRVQTLADIPREGMEVEPGERERSGGPGIRSQLFFAP